MCFLNPSGGGSGDVTQNSYYNSRPWEQNIRERNAAADQAAAADTATSATPGLPVGASSPKKPAPKRSSLTTGGSA